MKPFELRDGYNKTLQCFKTLENALEWVVIEQADRDHLTLTIYEGGRRLFCFKRRNVDSPFTMGF